MQPLGCKRNQHVVVSSTNYLHAKLRCEKLEKYVLDWTKKEEYTYSRRKIPPVNEWDIISHRIRFGEVRKDMGGKKYEQNAAYSVG